MDVWSEKDVPFIGAKKRLATITKNPIILNTFAAWEESHSLLDLSISFLRKTPLWGNPNLSHHVADTTLRRWRDEKIQTVADLYINNVFASYQQLDERFKLPEHSLFKLFQVREWVKQQSKEIFPNIPKESPLYHTYVACTTRGLTSYIYRIINGKLPLYDKTSTKGKWETDLGCVYDEVDWHYLLEQAHTILISTKHRQIQFNILHRTYYTPYRLHKIDSNISPRCQRCKVMKRDLLHMLWNCPVLEEFWKQIIALTSKIIGHQIEQDPKLWILGDTSSANVNYYQKYFILLASTAVKKCILINWKSEDSPSLRHWINELLSYCTPEKILYRGFFCS